VRAVLRSLISECLRPVSFVLRDRNQRELLRLKDRYDHIGRNCPSTVRFFHHTWQIPDVKSFLFQWEEIFVREIYRFQKDSVNPLIYDCGAHSGLASLYFSEQYPDAVIHAFEADPLIVAMLRSNILANHVRNVDVIDKAVWIHDRGVAFYADGSDGGSLFGSTDPVSVSSVSLSDILRKEKSIDMLKMNIEGAEGAVLKDSIGDLGKIRHLFIEYHPGITPGHDLHDILHTLALAGFSYHVEPVRPVRSPLAKMATKGLFATQIYIFAQRNGSFEVEGNEQG